MPRLAERLGRILVTPWILPAIVFLSFFWQLGAVPLYDLDEGAFSEATREMIASGNYITPHRDGEPRYDKPVLIYWLQAGSVALLGLNELALRLPSAIAAGLWLVATFGFARRYCDGATAVVAALVMALSLQVSLIAKAAVADAVLNLFIALAFFEVYAYSRSRARGALLRAYLWMGLGFLTKGPVALFFPLVVSFLFFASERAMRDWLRAAFAPLGWLIFLALTLPWYLAIYLDNGSGFFESFFLRHNLGRFGGTIHGHSGFPGYYFLVLPLIVLPFSGWLLRLIPLAKALWMDPLDRFLVLWFLTVFVVFSFSGTKLPHYLLYGSTPLFLLMARHRGVLREPWLAFVPPVVLIGVLALLPEFLAWGGAAARGVHQLAMLEEGQRVLNLSYRLATLAALVAVVLLALWRRPAIWERLVLVGFIQLLLVFGAVVPRLFAVMQEPVREAGVLARQLDRPTVVYRTSMPSFSVYRQAITPNRAPVPGDLVFLRVDKLASLRERYPGLTQVPVYRRGPVALVLVSQPGASP